MSVSVLLKEVTEMHKKLDRSAARRRMESLDAGIVGASLWRAFRRVLIFAALFASLIEFGGVPHLRVSYVKQGGIIRAARYWSVTGPRIVTAGEFAPTCPLILLVPLEKSLASYAVAVIGMEDRHDRRSQD